MLRSTQYLLSKYLLTVARGLKWRFSGSFCFESPLLLSPDPKGLVFSGKTTGSDMPIPRCTKPDLFSGNCFLYYKVTDMSFLLPRKLKLRSTPMSTNDPERRRAPALIYIKAMLCLSQVSTGKALYSEKQSSWSSKYSLTLVLSWDRC
jgi:hypothetical protein